MGMIQRQEAQCIYLNDQEAYLKGLRAFFRDLSERLDLLPNLWKIRDFYTIKIYVHGLKSAAHNIGAASFSILSEQMEIWAKNLDEGNIEKNFDSYLEEAGKLQDELEIILVEAEKQSIQEEITLPQRNSIDKNILLQMCKAAEEMDMLELEENLKELQQYRYEQEQALFLKQLIQEEENFEYDEIIRLLREYLEK